MKNLIWFLSLFTLESWCYCDLVATPSSAISKTGEHFPGFKVLCWISLQCCFRLQCCRWVPRIFFVCLKAITSSFWKSFFRDSLMDSMCQFFRIVLLMFCKNWLYVIAKGMRVLFGVSFLLPFMSSFPSSFSTVLMCLSNSTELYPCSRNRCLSPLQWCSKSFDVGQIRLGSKCLTVWNTAF